MPKISGVPSIGLVVALVLAPCMHCEDWIGAPLKQDIIPAEVRKKFPKFASEVDKHPEASIEVVLPGATSDEIDDLEEKLGIPLPDSYKLFLRSSRGFWMFEGMVQFGNQHPFLHAFPGVDELTPAQVAAIERKGGKWPPPSEGMLCFAEFSMKADGDQVLFNVSDGLKNGEYPVYYYSHAESPPSVSKLADTFEGFLSAFPAYPAFQDEDE